MARKISIPEAAEHCGVSIATIRRRIYDGSLPASRLGGQIVRIDVDDLERAFTRISPVSRD